jgi:septum formation topological specificity factor MinE
MDYVYNAAYYRDVLKTAQHYYTPPKTYLRDDLAEVIARYVEDLADKLEEAERREGRNGARHRTV